MNNEELIALLTQADEHKNAGNYSEAEKIAHQVLAIAESNSLLDVQSKTNNILGIVNKHLGNYDQALEYFSKALSVAEILEDKKSIGGNMVNIGNVYSGLGVYNKALDSFLQAIPIFEEIGEKIFKTNAMVSIGIVYLQLGGYDKALYYFFKALAEEETHGTKLGSAKITGNIGSVYFEMLNHAKALEYYTKALVTFEELKAKEMAARFTGNVGGAYYEIGNYDKAFEYYMKALTVLRELGIKSSIALVMGSIGSLYSHKNFTGYNVEIAEEYFLESIALSDEIGAKHDFCSVCKSLADFYKTNKRWEEFALYFEKFYLVEKEVQSEEAQKQAEQLEYRRKIEESERDRQVKLARFQEQEKILHNILPDQIADRMIEGEKTIVDSYDSVSVLFADIVGFTKLSQRVTPEQLVAWLDAIFNSFDQLADKLGCEKIKTIGDCYMVVAGLPERCNDHAERLGAMALEMLKAIEELPALVENISINMRIGIHSGSVVAGIIGKNKYAYDLWGDAVNTASRMESHGEAGKIHVSEEFRTALISTALNELPVQFIPRGEMEIKGKGKMRTYYLDKEDN
ncbi:MAG: tetratricopeptide repeat protein [Bacteroidetes bacterium]|nr:tetratricopeptide repeat protein [Bacteroidota bacterium]